MALMPPARLVLRGMLTYGYNKVSTSDNYTFEVPPYMGVTAYVAMLLGRYEHHEVTLLREAFEPTNRIIEAGSNIGVVASIAFNEKLTADGQMLCIEPHDKALPFLEANLNRQKEKPENADKSCSIKSVALGSPDAQGEQEFLSRENLGSGLSEFVSADDKDVHIKVPVTSLSEIAKAEAFSDGYSLICDMEGGEIPLIFEDAAALANCDQMLIELHEPHQTGCDETPEQMLAELQNMGFHLKAQSGMCYVLARR